MEAHWLDTERPIAERSPAEQPIPNAVLAEEGVLYRRLETDPAAYQGPLDELKAAEGYITQDEVSLSPETPNIDAICAKFVGEHFHEEDEVRFVLDGAGVFDIRSRDERWMRVRVEAGDLLVVPKERFHRFFLTEAKAIRCVRLFQEQSGWVPHYRS